MIRSGDTAIIPSKRKQSVALQKTFEQGVKRHRAGRYAEAEELYRRVLEARPDNPDVLHMLGVAIHQARQDPAAPELIQRAIALRPNFPQAYSSLGNLLRQRGDRRGAIAACRQAIALHPFFAEAYNNLGSALKDDGRVADAAKSYARAVELDGAYTPALYNLAVTLHELGEYEQAVGVHERAIAADPRAPAGYVNLGVTLYALGQFARAEELYRRALALNPGDGRALHNRALCLQELDRLDEALEAFRAAIDVDPGFSDGHWNYALALLSGGRFDDGWAEYEWRWKVKGFPSRLRHTDTPRWDGSALDGRTLLLYEEQGLGDTIHFVRYVSMVSRGAGAVMVEAAPALARLLRSLPGVHAVVATGDALPPFDVQLPMLSLPKLFATTLETVPAEVPYLHPDAGAVRRWQDRIPRGGDKAIGLVWAGSATHRRDATRSIALSSLAPLFSRSTAHWFSLQVGERAKDLEALAPGLLTDLSGSLADFTETAAAIVTLDLVITVDTAVAHLAGALGRPVWVLLPFVSDWRWLREREDSPWYPTMRLFRQPRAGDWAGVVERVGAALSS